MAAFYPTYAALLLMFIVIYMERRKHKNAAVLRKIIRKRRNGEMTVLLNGFEGREVTLYTLNDAVSGRIVEIDDGWVKIDSGKEVSTVNLDYVIRVREKHAKKKD